MTRPALPDTPTFCKGPFRLTSTLQIVGTDEFGGECQIANISSWGYLTGHGQALALPYDVALHAQRLTGQFIVDAMNEKMEALK